MKKTTKKPAFDHVPEITDEHANAFAEAFIAEWASTSAITAAISECGVMTWPEAPDDHEGTGNTAAQSAYLAAQDAIAEEIEATIRPALAQAFRTAAQSILGSRNA